MAMKIWRLIWIVALAGVSMLLFELFATQKIKVPEVAESQQKLVNSSVSTGSSVSHQLESGAVSEQDFKQSIYQNWAVPIKLKPQQNSGQGLLIEQDTLSEQSGGPLEKKAITETKPKAFNPLLESEKSAENRADQDTSFDYSYQGSEGDKHGVRLGVKSEGVTVRTDVKANSNGTEVQYIEIEVDLPK